MREGTTRYGFRYAVRRSNTSAAYCSLGVICGTRDEASFNEGIAHFTEHTVFKGTKNRSARAINSCLDKLGGELNAYTTKEELVLQAIVLKEDCAKALDLLLDLACNADFPAQEVEVEKGVVMDEIISTMDSPADIIFDYFEKMFFGDSTPMGNMILGSKESVSAIDSEELKRFYSTYFIPSRMCLSVVADIDEEKLEAMVLKLSDAAFKGAGDSQAFFRPFYVRLKTYSFEESMESSNNEINAVVGCSAPDFHSGKERLAAMLLSNVLGGPASNSVLNSILREKNGWVYNVECTMTPYSDSGIFAVSFGCDSDNLDKCLRVVRRTLAKYASEPLSPRTLAAAKRQMLGQMSIASDSAEARALSMCRSLMYFGRVNPDGSDAGTISSLTVDDLFAVSQKLFRKENISTLIYY